MKAFDLRRPEFVEKHRHQTRVCAIFLVEERQLCRTDQEFAQQRRHRHGAANLRQALADIRIDETVIAFECARRLDGMQRPAGNPDGTARRHNPQPTLDLATERTTLHQHDLAFRVAVQVQLDAVEINRFKTIGHDRPRHVVRIDPVCWFRKLIQDGHGRKCKTRLAELNNILSRRRNDVKAGFSYPIGVSQSRPSGFRDQERDYP